MLARKKYTQPALAMVRVALACGQIIANYDIRPNSRR
jgi:hypothetical protein